MNLIIDLCGPLLQIDIARVDRRLHELGVRVDECYRTLYYGGKVKDFDCGLIAPEEFFRNFRDTLHCQLDDATITEVWNKDIIADFDLRNVDAVRRLARRHTLFLLSNSDVLNEAYFRGYINQRAGFDFFGKCFRDAVFSNHVHHRKPEPEIFQYVVDRHALDPQDTVVVDDCRGHLESAATMGLHTFLCHGPLWRNVETLENEMVILN